MTAVQKQQDLIKLQEAQCKNKGARAQLSTSKKGIIELSLESPETGSIEWSVSFKPE